LRLQDLESHNGTWLAGQKVQTATLGDGAVFRAGQTIGVVSRQVDKVTFDISLTQDRAAESLVGSLCWVVGPAGSGKSAWLARWFDRVASGTQPLRVDARHSKPPLQLPDAPLWLVGLSDLEPRAQGHWLAVLDLALIAGHCLVVEENNPALLRADLAGRLAPYAVHMPRLVAQRALLPLWFDALVPIAGGWRSRLHVEALELLLLHDWPDNAWGIRAVLQRLTELQRIDSADLRRRFPERFALRRLPASTSDLRSGGVWRESGTRPDRSELEAKLEVHRGDIRAVATELGKDRRQVYRWLEAAGIKVKDLGRWRER